MPCSIWLSPLAYGVGDQTQAAGQLTPVGKAPPAEQLLDQHPGALRSDGAQPGQLRHQRLLLIGQLLALAQSPAP